LAASDASSGTRSTGRLFFPLADSQQITNVTDSTGRGKEATNRLCGTFNCSWVLHLWPTLWRRENNPQHSMKEKKFNHHSRKLHIKYKLKSFSSSQADYQHYFSSFSENLDFFAFQQKSELWDKNN
jgi:hypothetical protein